MKNICELFLNAAKQHPKRIAIIDSNASIPYESLALEVEQTAAYFRSKGIQPGDRVLVFVPMSIDLYRIVLGLFHCGATAVFLDDWVSKQRMELCCEIAQCKGFIGIPKARIFAFFSKELRRIPIKLSRSKKLNKVSALESVGEDATALITFTTGSTGRPKAANRTHGFLRAQFDALIEEIDPSVEDIDMPVLPIVLFTNLGVGCTSVIADFKMAKPELLKSEKIAQQIQKHGVNRITASPYFITRLTEAADSHRVAFDGIEKLFTGGAPVFPAHAATYLRAFPRAQINVVYGSTEAEPISSITADELVRRAAELNTGLPVGTIFHRTALKIIAITDHAIHRPEAKEFEAMELPAGEIGEIIVAGSHVLTRYYNNEAAFEANKIIVDGTIWHRTGDSGWLRDGELFLTGRCQQLIYKGDTVLSPFIVENSLQEIEGVQMGTLVEIEDQIHLIVETTLSREQLESSLVSLEYDQLHVRSIPRDPRHNSKIDYPKLEQQLRAK